MAVFDPSVYVIGTNRVVKIGWANAPMQRLAGFQIGSPVKLKLYFTMVVRSVENAKALEAWAHKALAHRRLHGEWFKAMPDDAINVIILGWQTLGLKGKGTYHLGALRVVASGDDKGSEQWQELRRTGRAVID